MEIAGAGVDQLADVIVLGSGVVGSSVALVASIAGHRVTLIGARRMSDSDASSDPAFASAYPAASIIPHSVPAAGIGALTQASDSFFDALSHNVQTGVRLQRHYELFEEDFAPPSYADTLRDFRYLATSVPSSVPKRPGARRVDGYHFLCFFCDMPIYGAWLDGRIDRSSVRYVRRTLSAEDAHKLDADVVVNCLGAGASRVFPDIPAGFVSRGILLLSPFHHPGTNLSSYNYTPSASVYSDESGTPLDVYFYPRKGDCVLGGTRQAGRIGADGCFEPLAEILGSCTEVGGVLVPEPILSLNAELVQQLTGRSLPRPMRAMVGYRHMAGTPSNARLVIEPAERPTLPPRIDCYGFGGAGVTLSWGAAVKVLGLVARLEPKAHVSRPAELATIVRSVVA